MRKQKTVLYTRKEKSMGACEYKIWDKEKRALVPCAKTGHLWFTGVGKTSHFFCDEHGEFWADAHDMRDTEIQATFLKKE